MSWLYIFIDLTMHIVSGVYSQNVTLGLRPFLLHTLDSLLIFIVIKKSMQFIYLFLAM